MNHVKFVVLSQPRTGSTLFSSYMSSHPGIRCVIEPINPKTHSHHMQPIEGTNNLIPERMVQGHIKRAMDILFSPELVPQGEYQM